MLFLLLLKNIILKLIIFVVRNGGNIVGILVFFVIRGVISGRGYILLVFVA